MSASFWFPFRGHAGKIVSRVLIMFFINKFFNSIRRGRPDDFKSVEETFPEELNRQCERFVLFGGLSSLFVWLPYIQLDQQLHPGLQELLWLRLGFSLAGVIVLILYRMPRWYPRGLVLISAIGMYMEIATAVITGLVGVDPAYMGGYLIVLMYIPLVPLPRRVAYTILGSSLAAFFGTLTLTGQLARLGAERYSRNDLLVTAFMVAAFIYVLDSIRYRSWMRSRQALVLARAAQDARTTSEEMARITGALANFSRRINETSEIGALTREFFDFFQTNFNLRRVVLLLTREDQACLESVAVNSNDESVRRFWLNFRAPLEPGTGSLWRTYRRQKILYMKRFSEMDPGPVDAEIIRNNKAMTSFLHIPLVVQSRTVGIMLAIPERDLSRGQVRNIERFCSQIAGAVYNSNLMAVLEVQRSEIEAERRRATGAREQIERLAAFTRQINESRDLSEIIHDITEFAVRSMNMRGAFLTLVDEHDRELFVAGGYRTTIEASQERLLSRRFPLTEESGLLYHTYRRKKTVHLARLRGGTNPLDRELTEIFGYKSFCMLPLLAADTVIGVLAIDPGDRRLSREDIHRLEAYVAQIAGAVQRARHLAEAELARLRAETEEKRALEARAETELLAEIARRANEGRTIEEILTAAMDILKRKNGVDYMTLYVVDQESRTLIARSVLTDGEQRSITDFPEIVRAVPLVPESSVLYQVYKKKRPIFIKNLNASWLKRALPIDLAIVQASNLSWFFILPMVVDGDTVGILSFSGKRSGSLGRPELQFAERVTAQIAGAVRASELLRQAEQARKESDLLLARILPRRVADELKREGVVEPLWYDQVSVMFTDFVGFTQASQKMLPDELIKELDGCFSQFDEVARRNNVEKLKTIGDAYMCAAGLPTINQTHAVDICLAALEFRSFMDQMAQVKIALGHDYWQIRIGIHSGPVTAGVIGQNKFSYDIWGDTVNTASRMESSGEAGKINISEATRQLVGDFFVCESRGWVKAKGKGEMEMFFLLRIRPELSADEDGLLPNGRFEKMRTRLEDPFAPALEEQAPGTSDNMERVRRGW